MYGLSSYLSSIIGILIILAVIKFIINRGIVHLSLSKFTIVPENDDLIIIEGRKTGLIQWILVQLKLGNIYKIQVKKDFICYSEDSAFGKKMSLTPMQKISSTTCGYKKPVGWLMLGVALVIMSFVFLLQNSVTSAVSCLLIAALLIVAYIYLKSFFITIESMGSSRLGFSFRKALIENLSIDIEKIEEAIQRINDLVVASK